ncbi:MAG: hypothetical protein AB7F43_10285 [Bacteriovoracia bacterium]
MRKNITIKLLFLLVLLPGCLNSGKPAATSDAETSSTTSSSTNSTSPSSGGSSGGSSSNSNINFTITKVAPLTVSNPNGGTSASSPDIQIFFNAIGSNTLRDVCQEQSGGSSNPARQCKCRFTWAENNLSDSTVITRTEDTDPKQITSFQVNCNPLKSWNEITEGTSIRTTLVPDSTAGNSSSFTTNVATFNKQTSQTNGDFRDIEGNTFKNVFHYACFDKIQKPLNISRSVNQVGTKPDNTTVFAPSANDFTIGGDSQANSEANPYSAQSYYFDFYIRNNEQGSIVSVNSQFTCPTVNVEGTPSFFPMDSTFALALNRSSKFNVEITSRTLITETSNLNVLGYAAQPNSDGTCPAFTLDNGKIGPTYRLRKYVSVYPIRYDVTGDLKDTAQPVNYVFVLDRPVSKIGVTTLKPITRLGPKPCPFSFKSAELGQKCMSDGALNGHNIDGTQIDGDPGCPIFPPVKDSHLKDDGTLVIRPYRPFTPNFIEDTGFKACAFQSNTPKDPDIVVYHDETFFPNPPGPTDFYCAKHYPAAGAIIPSPLGDPFDKNPGDCSAADTAAAIKSNKAYACSRTYNPTNSNLDTPAAGCCQVCSGTNCSSVTGVSSTTPSGRNAAFNPPNDAGNPNTSVRVLPRAIPNATGGGGCFDPSED